MKWKPRDPEVINRRCIELEKLGFEIQHQDSHVHYYIDGDTIDFDFSAIADDKLLVYAIRCIYECGLKRGRNEIRREFHSMLEQEEDES